MQLLNDLKAANFDRLDLDEAVSLLAFASSLDATYKAHQLETPDWLKDKLPSLRKEVDRRRRDSLEAALKSALARRDALRTSEEKRKDTDAEIARLQASLGEAGPKAVG